MNTQRQQLLQALIERMACVTRTVNGGKSFPFNGCTLSQNEARVLMYIAQSKSDGMSVKELAMVLQVTSGAITQTIDGLVEKELVTRQESKEDRRLLQIVLTKKARREFDAFQKRYVTDVSPVFETLSDGEVKQLTTLLSKVSNSEKKGGVKNE